MSYLKQLAGRLTPPVVASLTGAVLVAIAAFGVTLDLVQQAAIVAFATACAVVVRSYLNPEALIGLVAAAVGVATALGLPVTSAQRESILLLAGAIVTVALGKGAAGIVKAGVAAKREPAATSLHAQTQAMGEVTTTLSTFNAAARSMQLRKRKCGRLPAFRPPALKTFLEYAAKVKAPPATFKAPAGSYPIDNNDVEGDCTIAGVAHLIAAWNRLFGIKDAIPRATTIKRIYRWLTGGADTGLVVANVLATWRKPGLFGHTIWGYAPVKVTDANAIKQAIAYYGGCYLGIACPESAQRQFEEGVPWTNEGEHTEDGHCIVAIGYDAKGNLECATWGRVVLVTPGFLKAYLDEAWVVLSHQLVDAGKDTLGLNIKELQADLASV